MVSSMHAFPVAGGQKTRPAPHALLDRRSPVLRPLPFLVVLLVLAGCATGERPAPAGDEAAAPATEPVPSPYEALADSAAAVAPAGPAPDFTLPTLSGDSLRLSELRGRVVVLNFWATWCAPCRAEIPDLAALHDDLQDRGLMVVGVSLDEAGMEVVRAFAEETGITYPVVLGDEAVAQAYGGIFALPTTFVIDPEGRIVTRVLGLFPTEQMRPALESLLAPG